MDWIEQLERLAALKSQGLLTEEEFSAEKAALMQKRSLGGAETAPQAEGVLLGSGETPPPTEGSVVGSYKLIERLGAGGMGEVFRVEHQNPLFARKQGPRAIKLMRRELQRNESFRARFAEEALLGLNLRHAHLAEHLELVDDGRHLALVMAYIEGRPFRTLYQRENPQLSPLFPILRALGETLDYLHGESVIHRDLKPSNLILRGPDDPVLLDFGVAKQLSRETKYTQTGGTLGTVRYMAPEQLAGKLVGPPADQYAFALIIYELIVGSLPWEENSSEFTVGHLKMTGQLAPIPPGTGGMSEGACAAIMRALSLDPAARHESCTSLVMRLQGEETTGHAIPRQASPLVTTEGDETNPQVLLGPRFETMSPKNTPAPSRESAPLVKEATPPELDREAGAARDGKTWRRHALHLLIALALLSWMTARWRVSHQGEVERAFSEATQALKGGAELTVIDRFLDRFSWHPLGNPAAPEAERLLEKARAHRALVKRRFDEAKAALTGGEHERGDLMKRFLSTFRGHALGNPYEKEGEERLRARWFAERIAYQVGEGAEGRFYTRRVPALDGAGAPFEVMEVEVTQALYARVAGENPSHFRGARRPVERVSWEDGLKFANQLSRALQLKPAYLGEDNHAQLLSGQTGFRFLSDAEWTWAARCGEAHDYAGSAEINAVAWYKGNSESQTHPVGLKAANQCGLKDLSGNVWEWVADALSKVGPYHPGAAERVFRGGGWNHGAGACRVSFRYGRSPARRSDVIGLRFARSVDPSTRDPWLMN